MMRRSGVCLGVLAALALAIRAEASGVRIARKVESQRRELAVETMRCSAMPVNIRWPGHQREQDQTELCRFARFDFVGKTVVWVDVPEGTREVVVRPLAKKVAVNRAGGVASFTLTAPGAYSVEFDGRHRNLMIFADPPHDWSDIDRTAANVRWFGPGEHDVGVLRPKAGETVFLDEGAMVYGRIEARDAHGLRICGHGILDASRVKEVSVAIDPKLAEEQRKKGWAITNVKRFDAIRLMFCDDVRIEGITVRDSQIYAIRPVCCDRFTADNVKILGSWRYNSDGIDMHNCRQVRIRDSFIRTYDDSICVKGFDYVLPEEEMLHDGVLHDVFEDVLVERCTIWNDWGRALEIGAETRAREIRDVTFRDCDVLAVHDVALDVQNSDQAHVHDILFENIRVEYDSAAPKTVYSASAKDFDPASRREPAPLAGVVIPYIAEYSKAGAENRGRTSMVIFRDIDVFSPTLPTGFCRGFDAEHRATDIVFERIRQNGQDVTETFVASVRTNAFGAVRSFTYAPIPPLAITNVCIEIGLKHPFSILHVSDSHLLRLDSRSDESLYAFARNRSRNGRELGEHYLNAAFEHARRKGLKVVHTGDFMEFASAANLEYAVRRIRSEDVLVCPGNHEYWTGASEGGKRATFSVPQLLKSAFQADPKPLAVGDGEVTFFVFDDAADRVSAEVVAAFGRAVALKRPIVLVCHVPFYVDEMSGKYGFLPGGPDWKPDAATTEFIRLIRSEPLVRAILCGHLHASFEVRFSPTARQYVAGPLFGGQAREIQFK